MGLIVLDSGPCGYRWQLPPLCFSMKIRIMLHFCSCYSVIDIEGFGRGAIAQKDLEVGDIALEIPVSAIISEDAMRNSDIVCFPLLNFVIFSYFLSPSHQIISFFYETFGDYFFWSKTLVNCH